MLTDTKASAVKAKGKPYKLADRDGLYLYVTPSGAKSWRFDYRVAGARETLSIGLYPDVGLERARDELGKARKLVAKGESPARAKQDRKSSAKIARANTLQAVGRKWYQARAAYRSASWQGNAKRWLEGDFYPAIGSKPIQDVTADDVERVVRQIADKRGAKSAEYARIMLAAIFKSLPRAHGVGNPARDLGRVIEPPKVIPRGRALTTKEIPVFLEAADRYPGNHSTKLAIRLLMLTFVRKRELIEAKWSELDLKRGEWVIPAERMKMDGAHTVPLSRQAVECFEKLKPLACGSDYVFPHFARNEKPMNASTINMAFYRIGYAGKFTPHGARSTASTALNAQGWSVDAIERQLAHAERDLVRAAYNQSDYMVERKKMMQAWADYVDGLCAGADVVPIKRKA